MAVKIIFSFTILVFLTSGMASAQTCEIDSIVLSYVGQNQFSGNVLAAKGDSVLFAGSYGPADREWNMPNGRDTKFRIASLTKQFTATLIMQLVQSGKMELHKPLTEYLSYYRKDTGDSITIHHLLTHTAGLQEYTARSDFFSGISKQEYTTREFVEKFCSDDLVSVPGAAYKYSNTGYYILGAVIEEVTGEDYAEVLRKNILDVAGMRNTGMDCAAVILPGRAMGYNYSAGVYSNAGYIDLQSTIFSAGAMYSTTEDLLLWHKTLFFSDKLLSEKNRETMLTPYLDNYGYGFGITRFTDPLLNKEMHYIFHQGAINGFRSLMTYVASEDIIIILLCNNFDSDPNPINNAIVYSLRSALE